MENYLTTPKEKSNLLFYGTMIIAFMLALVGSLYALNFFGVISFKKTSSKTVQTDAKTVQTETQQVQSDNLKTDLINKKSSKNREAAKSALNALSEIKSVVSLEPSFTQYSDALQSAKIKFDIAIQDFEPQTDKDKSIQQSLESILTDYVNAKDAWKMFINYGNSIDGCIYPNKPSYSFIHNMRLTEGYSYKKEGEETGYPGGVYCKDEVIEKIWMLAGIHLIGAKDEIK